MELTEILLVAASTLLVFMAASVGERIYRGSLDEARLSYCREAAALVNSSCALMSNGSRLTLLFPRPIAISGGRACGIPVAAAGEAYGTTIVLEKAGGRCKVRP